MPNNNHERFFSSKKEARNNKVPQIPENTRKVIQKLDQAEHISTKRPQ